MNVSTQKFQSQKTVNKPLAQSNHRTTLPQSALSGCQLPQRGSRDAGCTIQCAAQKPQRCGRFSSPLRNSKIFTFHHSSNDTPSASLRSAAPSEREPGTVAGADTIQLAARKPQRCGRFSSPLRNSKILRFYHSTDDTPSVSLRSTAPSEREPGTRGCVPFNLPVGNRNVAGDFHRPYENSEYLAPQKLPVSTGGAIPGGAGHPRIGTIYKRN